MIKLKIIKPRIIKLRIRMIKLLNQIKLKYRLM